MHNLEKILLIGMALCGLMFVGTVAAEVDWTDGLTDPSGDVMDGDDNIIEMPGADIVAVSITEEGDDLNISMVLDGEYNGTGMYTVYVEVDGSDSWSFSRMNILGFSASDPDWNTVPVNGYYSSDGKTISWVIAKVDIPATSRLSIEYASSSLFIIGGEMVSDDTLVDAPVPGAMELVMNFPKLNQMQMKVTMTYKGDDAKNFRTALDEDRDGTISDAEITTFEDQMDFGEETNASESNVTYDGEDPTDMISEASLEGAKGAVDSATSVKIVVTMKLIFSEPEDKDDHVIVFKDGFFDDDFVGGDEPWDNQFDMMFKFQSPDGWTFKSGTLPSKMKNYMNDEGNEITMDQADIQKEWNSTFGGLDTFTIEQSESPGFGLVVVVITATFAAIAVGRRR